MSEVSGESPSASSDQLNSISPTRSGDSKSRDGNLTPPTQSVNIYDLSNAADLMVNSILLQVSRSLDPVNYSGSRVISPFPSAFPIEESEKSCSDSDQSGGRYSLANQNNNNSSTDLSERRRFF